MGRQQRTTMDGKIIAVINQKGGTGKTTLCRLLLEQVPANTRVALVLNPRQTPVELEFSQVEKA